MNVQLETITPEKARVMLAANTGNRPFRPKRLRTLIDEVNSGQWKVNGDAIRFSSDGELIDGQHRLTAIIQTGKSIQTLVIRGLEPEAKYSIDLQAARTGGDMLAMNGEKNAVLISAALPHIHEYMTKGFITGNPGITPRKFPELMELYDTVRDLAPRCHNCKLMYPSILVALYYLFYTKDPEKAGEWVSLLNTGAGLTPGHPILVFRERLIRSQCNPRQKLSRVEQFALAIKSWNLWRANKSAKRITWMHDGGRGESFPTIS